jgi:hypothetical protein
MIYIERDRKLIDMLTEDLSLTSSSILRLDIYSKDGFITIDVYINLLYARDNNNLMLRFGGVQSFNFFHQSSHSFGNIEIIKFFSTDGKGIYISFDPVDEDEIANVDDNDYIESESVEGYFL